MNVTKYIKCYIWFVIFIDFTKEIDKIRITEENVTFKMAFYLYFARGYRNGKRVSRRSANSKFGKTRRYEVEFEAALF
jgi:hypothetical protein